jgi:hypothetical protein
VVLNNPSGGIRKAFGVAMYNRMWLLVRVDDVEIVLAKPMLTVVDVTIKELSPVHTMLDNKSTWLFNSLPIIVEVSGLNFAISIMVRATLASIALPSLVQVDQFVPAT